MTRTLKQLFKNWEKIESDYTINLETNEDYRELLEAIKKTIGKITRWYRSSETGISIYTIRDTAKFINKAYYMFYEKDKGLSEAFETTRSVVMECFVNEYADHRMYRGNILYEAYVPEKNFEDTLGRDATLILENSIFDYQVYELTFKIANKIKGRK